MSVFTGTKKRKARMILICRYFVLVCVVVFVCVLCVHGVCRLHSVCCVCLCLLKMNKNLMWTTGEKTCLIVISLRKQKSHVEQKTKRLGTAHLQNEYQQKSRMDRKRGKVCMRLMFSTITDVFVASIWKWSFHLGCSPLQSWHACFPRFLVIHTTNMCESPFAQKTSRRKHAHVGHRFGPWILQHHNK